MFIHENSILNKILNVTWTGYKLRVNLLSRKIYFKMEIQLNVSEKCFLGSVLISRGIAVTTPRACGFVDGIQKPRKCFFLWSRN